MQEPAASIDASSSSSTTSCSDFRPAPKPENVFGRQWTASTCACAAGSDRPRTQARAARPEAVRLQPSRPVPFNSSISSPGSYLPTSRMSAFENKDTSSLSIRMHRQSPIQDVLADRTRASPTTKRRRSALSSRPLSFSPLVFFERPITSSPSLEYWDLTSNRLFLTAPFHTERSSPLSRCTRVWRKNVFSIPYMREPADSTLLQQS